MPESSARAGKPSAAAPASAFRRAFSRYVLPVSSTSGQGPSWFSTVSHATGQSAQILVISRSLWALWDAIAIRGGSATSAVERVVLDLRELHHTRRGEVEEVVQLRPIERRSLGRALHLDEGPRAGHHDVAVDLGGGVLLVAEVEPRLPVDEADGHGGHAVDQEIVGHEPGIGQTSEGEREREVATRDRRRPCAGIGLQDVTVDRD